MVRVARLKQFDIYSNKHDGYIVYNTNKPFNEGHTHINGRNSFKTAMYIAKMAYHKRIPYDQKSEYILTSIIRISRDNTYTNQVKKLRDKVSDKKKENQSDQ